ncbi:hypothetical protein [Streptomyces sp. NPDC057580]|uniref:hypothetical protein n=1 Tax=Streptomyces sp. NPDC057580 TaxID=3346173 RepID=UPI0036B308A1
MGTDIYGFIECRASWHEKGEPWSAAVDFDLLYMGRSYDAFGCLLGVRNRADFRPLAADRGLPEHVCDRVRRIGRADDPA